MNASDEDSMQADPRKGTRFLALIGMTTGLRDFRSANTLAGRAQKKAPLVGGA